MQAAQQGKQAVSEPGERAAESSAAAKELGELAPSSQDEGTTTLPRYPGIVRVRLPPTITRYLPLWLRDLILARDGYQCTFVGPDGKRCPATRFLQIDHIRPFSLGGGRSLDPEEYRTLCACHNLHQARKTFGALVPTREVFA